jgi:hypothetical protein
MVVDYKKRSNGHLAESILHLGTGLQKNHSTIEKLVDAIVLRLLIEELEKRNPMQDSYSTTAVAVRPYLPIMKDRVNVFIERAVKQVKRGA